MTIGTNIIKFDNSLGTVKEFNEIFHLNKLKDCSGDVEILGIVGVGKETTRLLSVSGELREYDFAYRIPRPPITRSFYERKEIYTYTAEKDGTTLTFKNSKELAKVIKVKKGTIEARLVRKYSNIMNGYVVNRTLNK